MTKKTPLFNDIDPVKEFGISRFVADRMYYLNSLMRNAKIRCEKGSDFYTIESCLVDSSNNSLRIEQQIRADSDASAVQIAKNSVDQLCGIEQKIWLTCWEMANTSGKFTYRCRLTDLMKRSCNRRSSCFSDEEKRKFFCHIKSLGNTRFIFTKRKFDKTERKKQSISHSIPLLCVRSYSGEGGDIPIWITITMMNLDDHNISKEKLSFVGAKFRKKTINLHAKDVSLANFIQIRKNQQVEKSVVCFERESLIRVGGLEKTDITNKTVANKQLWKKLERLVEKKIINGFSFEIKGWVEIEFDN